MKGIMKKYTTKQITETIKYWQKQLNESFETLDQRYAPAKSISLVEVLESLDVFDECGRLSDVSGIESYHAKYTSAAEAKLKAAFSKASRFHIKLFGLVKVMSSQEYAVYVEDYDISTSYKDYLDNEIYKLKEALHENKSNSSVFDANGVVVVDDVAWDSKPGKTVLVVPYIVI